MKRKTLDQLSISNKIGITVKFMTSDHTNSKTFFGRIKM
jgi:hypothetical protein